MAHYSLAPDLAGKTYGTWLVLSRNGSMSYGGAAWLCRCECGTERTLASHVLTSGKSTNCGCRASALLIERSTSHGLSKHPLYRAWGRMKDRCYYQKHRHYARYGGRGITVCDRWQAFHNFYADNIGIWQPGLTLDRIDNDGQYSPDNCRWTNRQTQSRNRSNAITLTARGETRLLVEWAEITGLPPNTLRTRKAAGWSDERAIMTPYLGRDHQ